MAGILSRRLGWKRTRGKNVPKLGITRDQASTKIYGAAYVLSACDLSLATDERGGKNYSETAIDALLLKRTRLLQ